MILRVPRLPLKPSARQIAEYELMDLAVWRRRCRHSVTSKGRAHTNTSREEGELPDIGIDYGFSGRDREDVLSILSVKCRSSSTGCLAATVVDRKGASDYASSYASSEFNKILVRSAKERSLVSLIECVSNNLRLGYRIDEKDPLTSWTPFRAANCVSRYRRMDDGRVWSAAVWQDLETPSVEFGESLHFRPVGESNARRRPEDVAWCLCWTSREIWCCDVPHARWCEAVNENRESVGA